MMNAQGAQQNAGGTADRVRNFGRQIAASPGSALLAALAVGFVVGLLLRILEKPARDQIRGA